MDGLCAGCSRIVTSNSGCPYCGTDNPYIEVTERTRGHEKAAICRSNQCGRYDKATDTCRIQVTKGKGGHVRYLYSHPETQCPNDPPMWKVDNGSDEMEARKSQP
jgi:hypothetical protein